MRVSRVTVSTFEFQYFNARKSLCDYIVLQYWCLLKLYKASPYQEELFKQEKEKFYLFH